MRVARLICVTENNNNKYYNMTEDNGQILVEYGRVGASVVKTSYPMSQWEKLYRSKVKKGYKDVTELRVVKKSSGTWADITDHSVRTLVEDLQNFANANIQHNYTVSTQAVTEAQVVEAQKVIDQLSAYTKLGAEVSYINRCLLELYAVIPRRLDNVKRHILPNAQHVYLAKEHLDFMKGLVTREQDALDVMKSQVQLLAAQNTNADDDQTQTILDARGLVIVKASPQEEEAILKLLSDSRRNFRCAYKVINNRTEAKFRAHVSRANSKVVTPLWHGSRNQNWWNIIDSGLLIRPSSAVLTGSMFGYGIYFAPRAKKSIGYTSLEGSYWAGGRANKAYLCVFDVHTGNEFAIKDSIPSWASTATLKTLQSKGHYDSLHAYAGHHLYNDEVIVYDTAQCTVRFIVEIQK